MSILGKKIKEKRTSKGLTQEDLAELSGVNLRTIQRIENNQSQPRGRTLILICDALDLDIESLLKDNYETEIKQDVFNENIHDNTKVFNYKLASKGTRLLATIVESFLLFIVYFIPLALFTHMSFRTYLNMNSNPIYCILSILSSIVLGAICYPYLKGNLGHSIFNLKVISAETGEEYIKSSQGALREFLKAILSMLIIPIIWILWDDKNQNLYDKFCKTYVVEKNSNQ